MRLGTSPQGTVHNLEKDPRLSQLVSQSHMFYVSGEKSIDKNISLSD